MTYSVLNTRNGKVEILNAANQGQALRAYTAIRTSELNAEMTDKQVNTMRTERAEDGAYELRRDGKALYRFACIVRYYAVQKPASYYADADRDGRQSDWESGKFHR